jgi:hypothetical protein
MIKGNKSRLIETLIKRRFIYLYLSIICFAGFIITYFVDGYMGLYDTLSITIDGKTDQIIEPFQWFRSGGSSVGQARWGKTAYFSWEMGNHEFTPFRANTEVSLWQDGKEVSSLVSQPTRISPFGAGRIEWAIDTLELTPEAPQPTHPSVYYIQIQSGEIKRELKFYIFEPPHHEEWKLFKKLFSEQT